MEDDKKSTLEKIQNSVYHVQQFLGSFASFFESLENVFNISIPFLSIICLAALVLTTILLYFLSLRFMSYDDQTSDQVIPVKDDYHCMGSEQTDKEDNPTLVNI